MRFFQGQPEIFDQFRAQVMELLGLPANGTEQPWELGITKLALAPHEYLDERYTAMIEAALASGIVEITREQYEPHPIENDQ